jgi:hypothetical protein
MPRKLSSWNLAVKKFGSIPKKGSADYAKLKAIHAKIKGGK